MILPLLCISCYFLAASAGLSLDSYELHTDVTFRFAHTTVSLQYRNDDNCTDVYLFTLQLPLNARLTSMRLTTPDGCEMTSQLQEVKSAAQTFLGAVKRGETAALINAFDVSSVSVTVSVPAKTTATVQLKYEEVLVRAGGFISVVLPLAPGAASNRIDATLNVSEPESGVVGIDCYSTLPDRIFTKQKVFLGNASAPVANGSISMSVLTSEAQKSGGFTDRLSCTYETGPLPDDGLLVFDGSDSFSFFFNPPSIQSLHMPKMLWFVVDVSGSMSGEKIADAKLALSNLLSVLSSQDRFGIATFSNEMPGKKWGPAMATLGSIAAAREFVTGLAANGGTNLNDACVKGVQMVGEDAQTSQVPILVLLTDGDASVGETRNSAIRRNVLNANREIQAKIIALAFGAGADYNLLLGLTLDNQGQVMRIYEGYGSSVEQMQTFLQNSIGKVLLSDVSVSFSGTSILQQTRSQFPLLAQGSEIVVRGLIADLGGSDSLTVSTNASLTVSTNAKCTVGSCNYGVTRKLAAANSLLSPQVGRRSLSLDRIAEMMDDYAAELSDSIAAATKEAAVALALQTGVLWPGLTSLVITESSSCRTNISSNDSELEPEPGLEPEVCINCYGGASCAAGGSPPSPSMSYESYTSGVRNACAYFAIVAMTLLPMMIHAF